MKRYKSKVIYAAMLFSVFAAFLATVGDTKYSRAEDSTQTTTTTLSQGHPVDTTTTVETTKSENTDQTDNPGIIGSFFRFVGSVIAFPFRVIGGAIKAVV